MVDYSDYRVEKGRFSVKLFLPDGSVKEGVVYLSYHAANHDGPEMVIDLLNQGEQFLPVNLQEGATRLINKEHIVMISFPADEIKKQSLSPEEIHVHNVKIQVANHGHLEGRFVSLLPTHARRVKDYLNQEESFLELRKGGDVYLINKDHVLSVEEKE